MSAKNGFEFDDLVEHPEYFDEHRVIVQIDSNNKVLELQNLYYPILKLIKADVSLVDIVSNFSPRNNNKVTAGNESTDNNIHISAAVAIVIFLKEDGMLGCERIQEARKHFENPPWSFHHTDELKNWKILPYPYNSQEFYYTQTELPLWAVRQVHYGKEHVRVLLFVTETNWEAMLMFYEVIIGSRPDVQRNDFCLFTFGSESDYDVQIALKKSGTTIHPMCSGCVRLVFKVTNIGHMVPLLPYACTPISERKWMTTDHDGNTIILMIMTSGSETVVNSGVMNTSETSESVNASNGFSI